MALATRSHRLWWSPALSLAGVALVASAAIGITAQLTRARVARNEADQVMKVLRTVLPEGAYDNEPHLDRILVRSPELLGSEDPLPLYRARREGAPAAAVITTVARLGYIGPIRLLVCLTVDGQVAAVRVTEHQETPGLGDRIEAARSDWIQRFTGRTLHDPELPRWAVRRDGGEFDQLTGATITSRAVVHAVRDAQLYFEQNKEEIFRHPAE